MKAKIEKLVLDIRGKKIELNLEEAKELKNALSEIFGADKVEHVHHYDHHVYPWRPWYGTYWCGSTLSAQNVGSSALQNQGIYQMSLTAGPEPQEALNAKAG